MKNSTITYKEINEQPVSFNGVNNTLDEVYKVINEVFKKDSGYAELIFTGCGTSLYLAQSAAFAFSSYTGIPARAVSCSELYFYTETYAKKGNILVLPITRSSKTTEVRLAIDKVRTFPNVKTLSITCDIESKNYNDYVILSPEADEQSIIMTKSFTSMLYIAIIMAMYVGGKKEEIASMMKYDRIKGDIILPMDKKAKSIVYDNPNLNLFIILGQGVFYGVANECMNKIKEMAIENSEAYQSMEYRHGPMSLVDKNTLIITLANEKTREYDVKLMKQMREYGAVTAAIGHNVSQTMPYVNYSFDMPDSFNDMQNAAFIGIFGQLIGYYLAEKKNIDADFPRHLSQAIVLDDGQVSYHPGK